MMFSARLKVLLDKGFRNQSDAALKLNFTNSFISRNINKEKTHEIIIFLEKLVLNQKISPEKLYWLITGQEKHTNTDTDPVTTSRIQHLESENAFLRDALKNYLKQLELGQSVDIKQKRSTTTAPP